MSDEEATAVAYAAMVRALHAYQPLGFTPLEASRHMVAVSISLMTMAASNDDVDQLVELRGVARYVEGLIDEIEPNGHLPWLQ